MEKLFGLILSLFLILFVLFTPAFADNATATEIVAKASSWLANLWENIDQIFIVLTAVISIASAIAMGTKTPDPNTFLGKAYKIVEWCALNFGRAKDTGK